MADSQFELDRHANRTANVDRDGRSGESRVSFQDTDRVLRLHNSTTGKQLAAADELNDFDLRARGQDGGGPLRTLDDAPVELDGQTLGIQSQIADETGDGFARADLACVAIHCDSDIGGICVLHHGMLC